MSESDNILIIALSQLGCLPKEQEIKSLTQLANEEFGRILLRLGKRISNIKGIDMNLPDNYTNDLTVKYRDSQRIVDFIKKIGYKSDLNINNVMFPTLRDMTRVLEFILEYLTLIDTGVAEYGQNFSETNLVKIKTTKLLSNWTKAPWMLPELNKRDKGVQSHLLKWDDNKISSYKKLLQNNPYLTKEQIALSKKKTDEIEGNPKLKLLHEEDCSLKGYVNQINHNYIVGKIKNKNVVEKTNNQLFVETLAKRSEAMDYYSKNYSENNFINNVKIIESGHRNVYVLNKLRADTKTQPTTTGQIAVENEESKAKTIYQNKLDSFMINYETEKEQKKSEINELNNKLLNLVTMINKQKEALSEYENHKVELTKSVDDLTFQNNEVIKEIEEKMLTFEQIQRLNKSEIKEDDINQELDSQQKKYDEMVSNWEEYSSQAKTRIEELKTSIETKKKEYNFKYSKIAELKKEIEETATKINLKQELSGFLNEEYQKIPNDINRNKYITKISELTSSINQEKKNIITYLNDSKAAETKIVNLNDLIKRADNELEDKLFQDAKSNSSLKDVYSSFINIREGYNLIQKNIIDSHSIKTKLKELENKVEDYMIKLKAYDYNQLQKQVEMLRVENNKPK